MRADLDGKGNNGLALAKGLNSMVGRSTVLTLRCLGTRAGLLGLRRSVFSG